MNEEFLNKMKIYLQSEYEDYLKSLENEAYKGIRVKEGFYIPSDEKLGKTIEHLQGLFYIQEPSATSVIEVLNVQNGDWVLDLCAAPGGKSTQIASKLKESGFLLSNEVVSSRANVLMMNMERCGISNAIITNSYPDELCEKIQGWFDKVLVDAPCSGEGMFKKKDQALIDWSQSHVESCAQRQIKILNSAYKTLKKEGVLVYSTCTYSMEENEMVVSEFLKNHPDMKQVSCDVEFGRDGFSYGYCDGSKVRRIFPMDKGEGHFIAKMIRLSEPLYSKKQILSSPVSYEAKLFLNEQLSLHDYNLIQIKNRVYLSKDSFINLDHIHVLREGILVGEVQKNRFEPNHHFYMSSYLRPFLCKTVDLNREECLSYLKGLTLNRPCEKGYVALLYRGNVIGFGKSDGTVIKNKFPKGLRI